MGATGKRLGYGLGDAGHYQCHEVSQDDRVVGCTASFTVYRYPHPGYPDGTTTCPYCGWYTARLTPKEIHAIH